MEDCSTKPTPLAPSAGLSWCSGVPASRQKQSTTTKCRWVRESTPTSRLRKRVIWMSQISKELAPSNCKATPPPQKTSKWRSTSPSPTTPRSRWFSSLSASTITVITQPLEWTQASSPPTPTKKKSSFAKEPQSQWWESKISWSTMIRSRTLLGQLSTARNSLSFTCSILIEQTQIHIKAKLYSMNLYIIEFAISWGPNFEKQWNSCEF